MTDGYRHFQHFFQQGWRYAVRSGALALTVSTVVAAIVAAAIALNAPGWYEATAQLYLQPAAVTGDLRVERDIVPSYVSMATSDAVLRAAMDRLGITDRRDFAGRVRAAQVPRSSLVAVTVRDSDPARAAESADAVADELIVQTARLARKTTAGADLDQQIAGVQQRIAQLTEQIAGLAGPPTAGAGASAGVSSQDTLAQLKQLESRRSSEYEALAAVIKARDELRVGLVLSQVSLVLWDRAQIPASPTTPDAGLIALIGALAGASVALLLLMVSEFARDRLRNAADVESRLGVSCLASIPVTRRPGNVAGKLVVRDLPASAAAAAFSGLVEDLIDAGDGSRPRVVVVMSARRGEGRSFVSANLALSFAALGPTVLVDADIAGPSQHRYFRVPSAPVQAAPGERPTSANLLRAIQPNLRLLVAGTSQADIAALAGPALHSLVHDLAQLDGGSTVIVDAPALESGYAPFPARSADAFVLVVDSAATPAHRAAEALAAAGSRRVKTLGVVLNRVDPRHTLDLRGRPPTPMHGQESRDQADRGAGPRSVTATHLAQARFWLYLYLAALAIGEILVTFVSPLWVFVIHTCLIAALSVHVFLLERGRTRSSRIWDRVKPTPMSGLLLALLMAPLIRLISLTLPLGQIAPAQRYLAAGIPMAVAALVTARSLGLGRREIGLRWRAAPFQLAAVIVSVGLGFIEYSILAPDALGGLPLTPSTIWPALSVGASTGIPEEIMFRGVMQPLAILSLGSVGLPYVAAVFAALHIGYQSLVDLLLVFGVGLFYGWVALRSSSIIGVAIGHGMANIVLFFVAPNLFGGDLPFPG